MTTPRSYSTLLPLAAVALLVALLAPTVRPVAAGAASECSSPVAVSAPASNLASLVANHAPGTCFVLANGTYRFHDVVPKDGMTFIGESTTGVIVDGRGFENAFHGTSDSVTIANMTLQDFDSSAGTKRQEQSPIRGTARLWASDAGQMATNWTIDSIVSQRNYAAGIFLGDHFTVRNSVFRHNGVTGISGDSFIGGLIEFNTVYENGANQATGVEVNGGGMKFGQAGTAQNPVVIRNNVVYDNPNIGIWCDIGCQGFHVIDNVIRDHVSRGVMYELSRNLVVRGNTVLRANTWTNYHGDFNAGAITVGESENALIENNRIEVARAGVVIRQTRRPASGEEFLANYPTTNYVTANVTVRNNVMIDVDSTGVSTGSSGAGIINDSNIVFVGNSYDDPNSMSFWWTNGQRFSFAGWQAAGRDVTASGSSQTPDAGAGQGGTSSAPPTTNPPASTAPPTTSAANTSAPSTTQASPSTTEPTSAAVPNAAPQNRPAQGQLPLRINAGGEATVDERGSRWLEDQFFVGGHVAAHAAGVDIRNTADDTLYREERWGAVGYDIPVPEGRYQVRLHHAEVFYGCQASDCREFSVEVEGDLVVSDIDLYDEVGGYAALVVETTQHVDDGVLSIRFSSSRQQPQISGIEVLPAPLGPAIGSSSPAGASSGASAAGNSSPGTTPTTLGSQAATTGKDSSVGEQTSPTVGDAASTATIGTDQAGSSANEAVEPEAGHDGGDQALEGAAPEYLWPDDPGVAGESSTTDQDSEATAAREEAISVRPDTPSTSAGAWLWLVAATSIGMAAIGVATQLGAVRRRP